MNKIFYAMAALALTTGFTACNDDDPTEAVTKHVYGDDEAPYLRTDASATITYAADFRKGHVAARTISLKDYAETIQKKTGMTVDDLVAGVADNSVVFYNINTSRGVWNKTAFNISNGWSYGADGSITTENQAGTITLDAANKALVVNVPDDSAAGVSFAANVGFAVVNGKDYDKYVRFTINFAVTDPGTVIKNVSIASGNYSYTPINFTDSDVASAIEACFGITAADFNKTVQDAEGDIELYMADNDGNWYYDEDGVSRPAYTANGIGFWCDANGKPMGWGSGCVFYVETFDGGVNIGRYEDIASGTVCKFHFIYVSKSDASKFVEFVVTATME